jgi:salicylate hydroxylase
LHVIVVGAGVGGLTCALSLARRGNVVTVLERADAPAEVGAGLQLSPNATRVLIDLGLEDELRDTAFAPEAAMVRDRATGRVLLETRLGSFAEHRWGAPYLQIHRADLHGVLMDAVKAEPRIAVRFGFPVDGVRQSETRVAAVSGDEAVEGDVLVGADGVRSKVREILFGPENPRFTGQVAWRGVAKADWRLRGLTPPFAQIWTGEGRHFVHYYLRRGELINVVGVVQRDWREESWTRPGDPADFAADFAGWPEPVASLIAAVEQPFLWALYGRDPLPNWTQGRATLLGDACHPMLPFLAQGAAMAIEDSAALARLLAESSDVHGALVAYEALRKPRTTKVQERARLNAHLFHLPPPFAGLPFRLASMMDGRDPNRRAMHFDWIYGEGAR